MARTIALTEREWLDISTILLDMDGTLLDLSFDNHFWLEHIPDVYASKQRISLSSARQKLNQLYQEYQGTLNWYCTDFWSEKLELDIITIKTSLSQGIKIRPGTIEFLELAKEHKKKLVLVTNAHPETLKIKLDSVDIKGYFDLIISSHHTDEPKESLKFWQAIVSNHKINLTTSLFVDDSESILDTALQAGVKKVLTVCQPDLSLSKRKNLRYQSVNRLIDIFEEDRR